MASLTARAHDEHRHDRSAQQIVDDRLAEFDSSTCSIPEAKLLTVDGEPIRLYEDLAKSKTVAISFVYTRCTTICSPIAANVGQLKEALGSRAGRDVHLISLTIDPENDTPPRLKAWSSQFEPGTGWTFVTGEKQRIDRLLKGLKVFAPNIEDHPPIMIIANDNTGDCVYTNGLNAPEELRQIIERIADRPTNETRTEE
jgi:protein SCO1/2